MHSNQTTKQRCHKLWMNAEHSKMVITSLQNQTAAKESGKNIIDELFNDFNALLSINEHARAKEALAMLHEQVMYSRNIMDILQSLSAKHHRSYHCAESMQAWRFVLLYISMQSTEIFQPRCSKFMQIHKY